MIKYSSSKAGISEVILYVSENNDEMWDSKIRFEVHSEEKANDFSD